MYLFCVRHFNDVDHITPIVWKMKQDNYSVAVYCINPRYDIDNDYRLNFLKKQGVIVESIYDAFDQKLNALHRSLRFLFLWFFAKGRKLSSHHQDTALPLSRLSQLATEIIGRMFYELARLGFYHTKWAYYVLEQSEAQALCFDHILPRRYVVGALLKAAKDKSVPTLALPHGVYLYTNESYKARTSAGQRFYKFNRFDYVIVQNQLRKDVLIRAGIAPEKIVVLGSARFCAEWIGQNRNILPRKMNVNRQSEKLKVVFMVSKPQCRIDIERLLNTFNLLSNFGEVEVMLKPHTRTVGNNRLFANVTLPNVADILTPELCEWADVVLVIGSSVMTEALMQEKPVLYLKYLHANTMLFEELGACWIIHDEAELRDALQSLRLNVTNLPYQDQDVKKFLSAVVYGGRNERDVLKDYVRFITECTTN